MRFPLTPLATYSLVLTLVSAASGFARQDDLVVAAQAYAAGELEKAKSAVEQAIAGAPNSAAAHMLLAEIQEAAGDDSDPALGTALELGADDASIVSRAAALFAARASFHYASETSYLAIDPRRRAEELYARWTELEPQSVAPALGLAVLLRDAGERSRAAGLALGAVARNTSEPWGHEVLWSFLGREIGFEQLAGFYHALGDDDIDPAERARCRSYESQVLKRQGNAEWSAAFAAKDRGEGSTHITRLEAARDCYQRAIVCARDSSRFVPAWEHEVAVAIADLHACIVRVLGEQRDVAGARRAVEIALPDLRTALALDPKDSAARSSLEFVADGLLRAYGDVAADGSKMKSAMNQLADLWTFATGLVDDSAAWWNNLGFTCREAGRYEESYRAYERCIEFESDSVRYVNDTGLILLYHLHRDLPRAEALFRRAVELGRAQYPALAPDDALEPELRSAYGDALLNLGLICARTRRADEADAPLTDLETLDPSRLDLVEARLEQALARGDAPVAKSHLATLVSSARTVDDEGDVMLATFEDGATHYAFDGFESLRDELVGAAGTARARLRSDS